MTYNWTKLWKKDVLPADWDLQHASLSSATSDCHVPWHLARQRRGSNTQYGANSTPPPRSAAAPLFLYAAAPLRRSRSLLSPAEHHQEYPRTYPFRPATYFSLSFPFLFLISISPRFSWTISYLYIVTTVHINICPVPCIFLSLIINYDYPILFASSECPPHLRLP